MAENRHPGINMHKLPVGGGFVGALFAIGSALIFVIGFPTLWYFVALAFALGVGVAIVLKVVSHHSADRNKPLSILQVDEEAPVHAPREHDRRRDAFQTSPNLCSV